MARRKLALAGLILVTVLLAIPSAKVGQDNSVDVWFLKDDPSLAAYQDFQERFGNDEVVAVAVTHADGVWRPEMLNALRSLNDALAQIEGVARVLSVADANLIEVEHFDDYSDYKVKKAVTGPIDEAAAASLRKIVEADPLLHGRLVTEDGKVAMVYVQMEANDDIDKVRPAVLENIEAAIEKQLRPSGAAWHVAGIGVIFNALNIISQTQGLAFMAGAFLVIFVLLWPLFRSRAAVFASVGAVSCAALMTRGLLGLFDRNENMVTMTLPVLVVILGVADCIHIFRYRAGRPTEDAAKSLAAILKPCLFTTLTTMVGFAALGTSRMAVVRDLGLFASAGIGFAFVSSVIVAAFVMANPDFRVKRPSEPGEGWAGRILAWTGRFSVANKEAVLGVCALLILICGIGIARVKVDTYSIGFLKEDHPVRAASTAMEAAYGPFTPLEIVIDAGEGEESIADPAVLRGMFAFERALEKDERVRDAFSIADVVARSHQLNSVKPVPFEVPDKVAQTGEALDLYAQNAPDDFKRLVQGRRRARITVSVPVASANEYKKIIEHTEKVAKERLPDSVTVTPSGYLPLYVRMMAYVVESQVASFGIAFVVVFLLIGLLFGSVRMSALAVLPNVLPVFVVLGVMGYLSINLDVATVTITSIIIGIVVDDTIHYLHRFREELRAADGDFIAATDATALSCGRAIGATTLIFSLGFLVLAGAAIKSVVYFGLLSALAMVVALVGDLMILPAVLVALKPKL